MSPSATQSITYRNFLEKPTFQENKPTLSNVLEVGNVITKQVTLKAETVLNCHKTDAHVLVIWLRGKAQFTAGDEEYTMQPGTSVEMPSGTPHGAKAETDCVFLVIKIHA